MIINDLSFFDGRHAVTANDGVINQPLDGSRLFNVRSSFFVKEFSNSNSTGVVWDSSHLQATFANPLNCYPVVMVFDSNGERQYPNVTIVSATSFVLGFDEANALGNETWKCVVLYGGDFGAGSVSFGNAMPSVLEEIEELMEQATALHDSINVFNADNEEY